MDLIRTSLGLALLSIACGPAVSTTGTDGDDGSTSSTGAPTTDPTTTPATTTAPSTSTTGPFTTTSPGDASSDDGSGSADSTSGSGGCADGQCQLDVVVVVDNSSNMAGAQRTLALAMVQLEAQLRAFEADVQVMFTTTDMGNQLCTPFEPEGYDPAQGSPIASACTDRLTDFTGLGIDPPSHPEACESVCPTPAAPDGDPFVAFGPGGENVPDDGTNTDIDGDGVAETSAARALACLAPMGINGCGFESPLEATLQALNPEAPWNAGARPFMRDGAAVGIVVLSDEIDCSVRDPAMMNNTDLYALDPDSGDPRISSAICWNAASDCTDLGDGTYDCAQTEAEHLQPLERYRLYLVDYLAQELDKPVFMLGLLGVPAVTEHDAMPPYTPTAGGVAQMQFRDWTEDDVLPEDAANGVTAADQQFTFGIGPSCSRPSSTSRAQGLPPLRMAELCSQLSDGQTTQACCMESICDDDYTAGMRCLAGMLEVSSLD